MNLILKDDSPAGRLAVSFKQQIDPCVGLRGKLVRSEPIWRRRGGGGPAGAPALFAGYWAWGPQSLERLLRGCRGMARGLGRGFLCGAPPALRAGCTWLYRWKGQASRQSWGGGKSMPPGPRGLALLQERRFHCGLLKEQVWGLSPDSPRDFYPDIILCCDPREFSLSRGSGGLRRD